MALPAGFTLLGLLDSSDMTKELLLLKRPIAPDLIQERSHTTTLGIRRRNRRDQPDT